MTPDTGLSLGTQIVWLLMLAVPVACVSWTVTHEEVFREPREYCLRMSEEAPHIYQRKFFYLFTCEYCFSHYVSALAVALAGFTMLLPGWRGFLFAWFGVVWIANQYMGVFNRLRLVIKDERVTIKAKEEQLEEPPE